MMVAKGSSPFVVIESLILLQKMEQLMKNLPDAISKSGEVFSQIAQEMLTFLAVQGVFGPELVSKGQLEDYFKKIGHFQANSIDDDMIFELNRVLRKHEIITANKISMFMATIGMSQKLPLSKTVLEIYMSLMELITGEAVIPN